MFVIGFLSVGVRDDGGEVGLVISSDTYFVRSRPRCG